MAAGLEFTTVSMCCGDIVVIPMRVLIKSMLGQDLAAGFDIAAGLVFGTAGFDLKKTAEPPSAHFLQNSQSLFSRLIFLIWATKCLLLKN